MPAFRGFLRALAALALFGAAGCFPEGVSNGASKAVTVVAKTVPATPSVVGAPATPAPSVLVTNKGGKPVPGVPVTFSVIAGGGTVSGEKQTTDQNGVATAGGWVLGGTPGEHRMQAAVEHLPPVVFTVSAGPAVPATAEKFNDTQSGVVGQVLAAPIGVVVKDSRGNPVSGVSVTFEALNGSSVATASVQTNSEGKASTAWTMGTVAGGMSATATAGALAPVTFSATAAAGAPAHFTKLNDAQSGTVGVTLPQPIGVTVRDSYGNLVTGAMVTFAATNGSSVASASVLTDGQAQATTSWTMGTVAGEMRATADAGSARATFTAVASAGSPHHVDKVNDGQSGDAGAPLAQPIGVIVRDMYENPVSGVAVTFAPQNGTSVSPASGSTSSSGQLNTTWTMGSTAGTVTLNATAGSLPAVTFTATAVATTNPCAPRGTIVRGGTGTGNTTASACTYGSEAKIDLWSLELTSSSAMQFVLSAPGSVDSPEYDTYLALYRDSYGNTSDQRGYNDDDSADEAGYFTTNSRVRFLGGPGSFLVGATHLGDVGGSYTLKAESWNGAIDACQRVFIVAGSSTSQQLDNGDCKRGTSRWSDRVTLYLKAGESVQITMRSSSFDAKLEVDQLVNGMYSTVASNDNGGGGTDAQVRVTASTSSYYEIHLTSVGANTGGSYTLTVTP